LQTFGKLAFSLKRLKAESSDEEEGESEKLWL